MEPPPGTEGMYAELVVQTKRNLPRDLAASLHEVWGPGVDASAAVALSALNDSHGWAGTLVRYAQITSDAVYLVFTPDTQTLKLHIEMGMQTGDMRTLRTLVEEDTRRVRTLLARMEIRALAWTARLYAENTHLYTGRLVTVRDRVRDALQTNLESKLYVPASAFLLSLGLDYGVEEALRNVGASLGALFLWLLGAAIFNKPGYRYEELL